jgi:heptosyltransferase-3
MVSWPTVRVLVIFPGALGDLICLGPTLRAIKALHQVGDLDLMARAELARFALGRLGVTSGHSIDRREVTSLFRAGSQMQGATREFFGQFDRIYSFFAADDPNFRRALFEATSGEVSFHPFRPPGRGHISCRYLESVGCGAAASESRLDLSATDLEQAECLLTQVGARPGRFVFIFPGSGSPSKNWPAERFAQLAMEIPEPVKPLVVLGPAESGMDSVFRSRGLATLADIGLDKVAALASVAAAFVGNDSGVSHLAAATGARGVALFGPTDPDVWAPIGDVSVIRRIPLEALSVDEALNILRAKLVS